MQRPSGGATALLHCSEWLGLGLGLGGRACTPGCVSCMNSKSLLTTVLRNFQCARRKRGYWPTTYLHSSLQVPPLLRPERTRDIGADSCVGNARPLFAAAALARAQRGPSAQAKAKGRIGFARGWGPRAACAHMMLDAMTALLSLPRLCSHIPSSSLMTVTMKRFSS